MKNFWLVGIWLLLGWVDDNPALATDSKKLGVFVEPIARSRSAVVSIEIFASEMPETMESNQDRFHRSQKKWKGVGTGFVIRQDGYLVTNYHVVAEAKTIRVGLEGQEATWVAKTMGSDARSDLALLKIDPPVPLSVLRLGESEELKVGSWVIAMGYPRGLDLVASKGIVSGKGRSLERLPDLAEGFVDYIQTDAIIDQGFSGGPLLNVDGEVIGVIAAVNQRVRGIGFAIPIDLVKNVLPQLFQKGRVEPAYLGVSVEEINWKMAQAVGLPDTQGVMITKVRSQSPAKKAGLRCKDVIRRFDGKKVRGRSDMTWRATTASIGKSIVIEVVRQGQSKTFSLIPIARSVGSKSKKIQGPVGR